MEIQGQVEGNEGDGPGDTQSSLNRIDYILPLAGVSINNFKIHKSSQRHPCLTVFSLLNWISNSLQKHSLSLFFLFVYFKNIKIAAQVLGRKVRKCEEEEEERKNFLWVFSERVRKLNFCFVSHNKRRSRIKLISVYLKSEQWDGKIHSS